MLFVFVPSVISSIVFLAILFNRHNQAYDFIVLNPFEQVSSTAIGLGFQALAIYFVIIWSREHNRAFDMLSA